MGRGAGGARAGSALPFPRSHGTLKPQLSPRERDGESELKTSAAAVCRAVGWSAAGFAVRGVPGGLRTAGLVPGRCLKGGGAGPSPRGWQGWERPKAERPRVSAEEKQNERGRP